MIVGENNSFNIVSAVLDNLEMGCNVTIFSQFLESLTPTVSMLKEKYKAINIEIFDIFTREYQVLPMRTHPLTLMDSFSGYILSLQIV